MRMPLKPIVLACVFITGFAASGSSQTPSEALKSKVDAVISAAYQSAAARFPCNLKARGKARMLRWEDVAKCLNEANDGVDWRDISHQLRQIREDGGFQVSDISAAVESSLSAHAVTYNKVFAVKGTEALLPLSSSLLKFLPENSLLDLAVYDQSGTKIGTFSGVYSFQKIGSISGIQQRHALFQYTDLKGNMQASPDRLLLDSFAVPWKDALSQPGFRLPSDSLKLR
jgi:hypothetical protein